MDETPIGTVTQSAGRFTIALVVQRLVAFGYFSFAAIKVGPESLGSYVMALNLAMIVGAIADLGLANVLTREASRRSRSIAALYGTTLVIKISLVAVAYFILQALAGSTLSNSEVRQLVWGTGVVMILDAITLLNYALVRAQGRLQLEGWGSIGTQLVVALAGIPLILVWPVASSMVAALLVGSAVNLIYSTRLIIGSDLRQPLKVSHADVIWIASITWPFALSLVLTRLYGYADGVVIGWMGNPAAVGLYGLPAKLTTALQFIPLAFVAALYPALASAYGRANRGELASLLHEGVRYLWLLGVGTASCVAAVAGSLVHGLYGSVYNESGAALAILIIQIPFLFISFPLGALLNACDRQRRTMAAMAVALTVDLILLVWLYPDFGIRGAAVASVISTLAMVATQLKGISGLVPRDSGSTRSMILAALTGVVVFALGAGMSVILSWWLVLLLTVLLFVGLSFLAGTLNRRDMTRLVNIIRRS